MADWIEPVFEFMPAGIALALIVGTLLVVHRLLERRRAKVSGGYFQIQLTMLALTLLALVVLILVLPVSEVLRGQLLALIGVLLSAAIALSSTTLVGNAMAGILLRVVKNFRLGDFIRVGEHFGRVSERGLFHTEIQTQDRDLTTVPNLFLVTHPVTVIHSSGTLISARVSLGYDVPRKQVEELLVKAASSIDLIEPFVHIEELGDFSVSYRVAGMLEDVKTIISARSLLRARIMDELHHAGVEIVSPNFMNTRAVSLEDRFIPRVEEEPATPAGEGTAAETLAFDKAEEAEASEKMGEALESLTQQIERLEGQVKEVKEDSERSQIEAQIQGLKIERERLAKAVEAESGKERNENSE